MPTPATQSLAVPERNRWRINWWRAAGLVVAVTVGLLFWTATFVVVRFLVGG